MLHGHVGLWGAPALRGLVQTTRQSCLPECWWVAQVLRPWCHFELPESDYVTGGRRNPDLPGPSGVLELLDPATKVCSPDSAASHAFRQSRLPACSYFRTHAEASDVP